MPKPPARTVLGRLSRHALREDRVARDSSGGVKLAPAL